MRNQDRELVLLEQVYDEYLALPGLQLTLTQAVRLWNSDRDACAQALETLVDASFLRCVDGIYVRADSDVDRMCA